MPQHATHSGACRHGKRTLWKHSEAYTQAPLPRTVGPPHRACVWLPLELGPFKVPCPWWPPLNGDPLASRATRGGSLVVVHRAQFAQEAS